LHRPTHLRRHLCHHRRHPQHCCDRQLHSTKTCCHRHLHLHLAHRNRHRGWAVSRRRCYLLSLTAVPKGQTRSSRCVWRNPRIIFHTRIIPVGWPACRLADMSSRIYGQQADPASLTCSKSPTSHLPRFGSPRVVYDTHVLAVAVVVLKPGGVALVRGAPGFWRVSSLFSIIPSSSFEVAKTGASASFHWRRPADLLCVHGMFCDVQWSWGGRGMPSWSWRQSLRQSRCCSFSSCDGHSLCGWSTAC
jgi:hypothetical protein